MQERKTEFFFNIPPLTKQLLGNIKFCIEQRRNLVLYIAVFLKIFRRSQCTVIFKACLSALELVKIIWWKLEFSDIFSHFSIADGFLGVEERTLYLGGMSNFQNFCSLNLQLSLICCYQNIKSKQFTEIQVSILISKLYDLSCILSIRLIPFCPSRYRGQ